ncbi:hypothetical protein B2J88_42420 [Rhodococcus sp. SRB_17]|uniref:hypothetical protein n=1 Tax=Rhodococcus sp. OK302 TaxID=1882769 RepID=UPI000B9F920D|nr:hypothetical protein [Rhodococcus sp. OK302]NMM90903.1 hypothetical protein [Rhodococcus sp. SRB_17]OYD61159.1 hypothetical protein BDB13_6107 [Rhodococcus sp. OK302]
MNAPIDHVARRRPRRHSERTHPALAVRSYSEYTRHLDAGATTLTIDSGPDQWLDLGHIPDNIDITITGQTCAAVTGGSITAAGHCFLQATHHARVTAYDFAHVEAFDTTTINAHDSSQIVGTDNADIHADEHAIVFAHCQCHVHAAGYARIAATDTTTVAIGGDAHVRASAGVHITGEHQSTNLTIDTRPISRLADQLNRSIQLLAPNEICHPRNRERNPPAFR